MDIFFLFSKISQYLTTKGMLNILYYLNKFQQCGMLHNLLFRFISQVNFVNTLSDVAFIVEYPVILFPILDSIIRA